MLIFRVPISRRIEIAIVGLNYRLSHRQSCEVNHVQILTEFLTRRKIMPKSFLGIAFRLIDRRWSS